jgi:hypothetical protein
MGDDNEERRNKILAFAKLKPDEQVEAAKAEAAKIKAQDDIIIANKKQIEAAENELKKLEKESVSAKERYLEARDRRRKFFALGKDTKELDAEIWKFKLDLEGREAILADSIEGLKNRISDLQKEITILEGERIESERTILEFEGIPWVSKVNYHLAEAMEFFKKIYENQCRLNYTFQSTGGSRFTMLYLSSWQWLEDLGKLYFVGNVTDEDRLPFGRLRGIFNFRLFLQERQKRMEEKE